MAKQLSERQRRAVSRLLRQADGHLPVDRVLAKQLERRGIVRITEHVYERWAWGKVEARLPVVTLAVSRAEAVALVQQDAS